MEYLDNGDLYQKIVEHQKKGQLFAESEIWNIYIQVPTFMGFFVNVTLVCERPKSAARSKNIPS